MTKITAYEKSKPLRDFYIERNPWILKYESAPRITTPSVSQNRIRACFEKYFGAPFPPSYQDWNRNHMTNLRLELDGYNENLKIAFEFNGTFYHYSDSQRYKDECKQLNCFDHQVNLLVIDEEQISPSLIKDDNELYEKVIQYIEKFKRTTNQGDL
jgi:hypothetical protein